MIFEKLIRSQNMTKKMEKDMANIRQQSSSSVELHEFNSTNLQFFEVAIACIVKAHNSLSSLFKRKCSIHF